MMSAVPKVLVVEDEQDIAALIKHALERSGDATVDIVSSGDTALRAAVDSAPYLVILDLNLPVLSGSEVCRILRARPATADIPIIMLTARTGEADRVAGLDLGADDYVTKPFSVSELLARVRAQLRRRAGRQQRVLRFAGLTVDLDRRTVQQEEREVKLTPTEFAILTLLTTRAGRPVSAAELMRHVVAEAPGASVESIRVHVGSLRRKLEPNPQEPRYFVTEPWVGYRFIAEPVDDL